MAAKSVMQKTKSNDERSKRVKSNDRSFRNKNRKSNENASKFERSTMPTTKSTEGPSKFEKSGDDGGVKKKPKKDKQQKKKPSKANQREKMKEGQELKSEQFQWKVSKLLGSGGFGDVYKVSKVNNDDKKEYAMKTEMVQGDRRLLRLKIEVTVLKACHEIPDPEKKTHFVEFVDRGITDKFKFLVMELVGPSLEDIRKTYLQKGYSPEGAMNCAVQTLQSLRDLHELGWLHRDIKPQNFAIGLGAKESLIYMLDFGIARKIFNGEGKEVKVARISVKFLGTIRFASRACHKCLEQGRKDDLETWLYMVYDLLDDVDGLPWKRAADREQVVLFKEKFFNHGFPKVYKNIFKEFKTVVDYINRLRYHDEPDYKYIEEALKAISRDNDVDWEKKPEWLGKLVKKEEEQQQDSETSTDAKQSGSGDEEDEASKREKKGGTKEQKSIRGKKNATTGGNSVRSTRGAKKPAAANLSMRGKRK